MHDQQFRQSLRREVASETVDHGDKVAASKSRLKLIAR